MNSKISFACPSCRARIKAPVQIIGQQRKCPGCDTAFIVRPEPAPTPSCSGPPPDAGPILIAEMDTVDMLFDDELIRPTMRIDRVQHLEAENARLRELLAQHSKAG